MMQLIEKYFPGIPPSRLQLFRNLGPLYEEWNSKVNLISRNDLSNLYERHVLHSLAIAKFIRFTPGTRVMDLGTGGGFPGIPLAIFFPDASFVLVDSISKKIKVVSDIISRLDLTNASAICQRAETVQGKYDYIVSRATAPMNDLYKWSRHLISSQQQNAIPNGIICLKGGELIDELKPFKGRTEIVELSGYFDGDWFETKKLVFLAI